MVVWIIGLSGSGKSTLALEVLSKLREKNRKVVHLDGDRFREAFGNDLGYTESDRLINARRIGGICQLLDEQGFDVICSILSVFQSSRDWMRDNIKNYFEVYITVDIKDVEIRNSKGIYQNKFGEKNKNIVGMHIPFEIPNNPDMIYINNFSKVNLTQAAEKISSHFIDHDN